MRGAGSWPSMSEVPPRSERFVTREARVLRKELLISPWPELGLVAFERSFGLLGVPFDEET